MGKNGPHSTTLALIGNFLRRVFGALFVMTEACIDVSPDENPTSEPAPDVLVMKRELRNFVHANPRPDDLHLVVEVSGTTLAFDLTTKAGLYARASIAEYWILDVTGRRFIVHRKLVAGQYESVIGYGEQESIAPLAAPHAELWISEAFVA
jgi:Uma2 family endonuclease